ncbi:MAG TPA: hypothetical protein VE664_10170 [Actinomycetes bacterium]|jgi:hypothetical protein|nr:hypothetical protein [Actinomycetes bacterium]
MARSQAGEQILAALGRVRAILDEVTVETRRTATEHESLAAWHAKRGEVNAARAERQAAAVLHLRLSDLDAARQALDRVSLAALDLERETFVAVADL